MTGQSTSSPRSFNTRWTPCRFSSSASPFRATPITSPKLDRDFPPFLRPLEAGKFVTLHASPTTDGTRVQVDYRYAHQEGVPETGTRIALLAHSRCGGAEHDVSVAPSATDGREFMLPASFAGTVFAEVQPVTATKTGPTYKSDVLEIGSADAGLDRSTVSK